MRVQQSSLSSVRVCEGECGRECAYQCSNNVCVCVCFQSVCMSVCICLCLQIVDMFVCQQCLCLCVCFVCMRKTKVRPCFHDEDQMSVYETGSSFVYSSYHNNHSCKHRTVRDSRLFDCRRTIYALVVYWIGITEYPIQSTLACSPIMMDSETKKKTHTIVPNYGLLLFF